MEFLEHCGVRQACVVMGNEASGCEELQDSFLQMEEMLRFIFLWTAIQLLYVNESNAGSGSSEQIIERIVKGKSTMEWIIRIFLCNRKISPCFGKNSVLILWIPRFMSSICILIF